jgi:hypothetical protein
MNQHEYMALRRRFWKTQGDAAADIGCGRNAICRREGGLVRISLPAELALFRAIAAKLIGKPLSPMPRIERKRKRAGRKATQGDVALAAFVGAKQPSPTRPQLPAFAGAGVCAAPGCHRQPGTAERLFCTLHEADAIFRGVKVMR